MSIYVFVYLFIPITLSPYAVPFLRLVYEMNEFAQIVIRHEFLSAVHLTCNLGVTSFDDSCNFRVHLYK